jgi:putative spermidine/putrescine transport system permease protein
VVLVPFWTSLMVRNYAWLVLLQDGGVVNDWLEWVGIGRLSLIGNVTGVVIGMSQVLLPFMVLPLYASLSTLDRRLLLAAEGLGAHPALAFARVYLPLSLPGALAGALMVFVLSLGFYITPALLGSPQNSLLSQHIVSQVNSLLAWGRGGAMAIVLLAVTFVLLAVAGRVTARTRASVELGGGGS